MAPKPEGAPLPATADGSTRLARSLGIKAYGAAAAAVSFALGGYTVHIFGYVNKLSGFVWMPLVILFFRRALLSEQWKTRVRCKRNLKLPVLA